MFTKTVPHRFLVTLRCCINDVTKLLLCCRGERSTVEHNAHSDSAAGAAQHTAVSASKAVCLPGALDDSLLCSRFQRLSPFMQPPLNFQLRNYSPPVSPWPFFLHTPLFHTKMLWLMCSQTAWVFDKGAFFLTYHILYLILPLMW